MGGRLVFNGLANLDVQVFLAMQIREVREVNAPCYRDLGSRPCTVLKEDWADPVAFRLIITVNL